MRAPSEKRPMFGGLARKRGWRDAAVVGLWLALAAGFLIQVTPAPSQAPSRAAEPVFAAATAAPRPKVCPDLHAPERTPRPVVLVEMVRHP